MGAKEDIIATVRFQAVADELARRKMEARLHAHISNAAKSVKEQQRAIAEAEAQAEKDYKADLDALPA